MFYIPVGTAGSFTTKDSGPASCYLIETETTTGVIDLGHSSAEALQKRLWRWSRANRRRARTIKDVDFFVVTHNHFDHCSDLSSVAVQDNFALGLPKQRLLTTRQVVETMDPQLYGTFEITLIDDLIEGSPNGVSPTFKFGDLEMRFARTQHGPFTLATAITHEGRTLVHTSDTGPGWSPEIFGIPIDVLAVDATYVESDFADHCTGKQAGEMARLANAAILIHPFGGMNADGILLEANQTFNRGHGRFARPIQRAIPGKSIDINRLARRAERIVQAERDQSSHDQYAPDLAQYLESM